jgi:glutathione synthase/RimK-type ligase-like ATP-grasp enzyme
MSNVYLVIEKLKDWAPYYPSKNVITFEQYCDLRKDVAESALVINLCRNYRYLSKGYYTSLLAEARDHKVVPNLRAINDLSRKAIYGLAMDDFAARVNKLLLEQSRPSHNEFSIKIFFGTTPQSELSDLAWKIFESYPFPILNVNFRKVDQWLIESIKPESINILDSSNEDFFAAALERFDSKIWRKPRKKRQFRYDLAILHNPDEKLPPSNRKALKKLILAAKEFSIQAELVQKRDISHLGEYDGLFIRETTAINHHTYTFARKAESEGLVVIDSPSSILRCANKVFLHEHLESSTIKTPSTMILDAEKAKELSSNSQMKFPVVLKIPDGSFSSGVFLVNDRQEFMDKCEKLFEKSVLILAQEYMYTDFDWRIGILNGRPLFSCRYFMSKGHWQIYKYDSTDKITSGGFEALPIHQTPKKVIQTAVKSTQAIGDGLYGVDLKERDGEVYVIEVNDNPNLDAGVEDAYLGDDLYLKIMEEFYRRFEKR